MAGRSKSAESTIHVPAEKVLSRGEAFAFAFLTFLLLAAIFSFLWNWYSYGDWRTFPFVFSVLTLILLIKLSVVFARWLLLPQMKRPLPMPARRDWKIGVATTFVSEGESVDMLERTVVAIVALEYPHDTWVLDESDDERVKVLCKRLGANYFSRKNFPQYQEESGIFASQSKYGNYNAWLHEIAFDRYDVVSTFDPDHVPAANFLNEILGYFDFDKVGFVQVAQAYYNQSANFIAAGAAEESYAYNSVTQLASFGMGYTIISGSHYTHRVAALKEIGGFAPHDADDLLLMLVYRSHDWKGVFVPKILARGLTPVDWRSYLHQQLRWGRAVLDIKFHIYPGVAGKLPLRERLLSFIHGLSYVEGGITTLILIGVLALMLITGRVPEAVNFVVLAHLIVLYLIVHVCDVFRQRFYLDSRERGLHWRAMILVYAKWPYHLMALCDVLRQREVPYVLTRKSREKAEEISQDQSWWDKFSLHVPLWPHWLTVIVLGVSWIIGSLIHPEIPLVLHLVTSCFLLGTLALLFTGRLSYPEPFDRKLKTS